MDEIFPFISLFFFISFFLRPLLDGWRRTLRRIADLFVVSSLSFRLGRSHFFLLSLSLYLSLSLSLSPIHRPAGKSLILIWTPSRPRFLDPSFPGKRKKKKTNRRRRRKRRKKERKKESKIALAGQGPPMPTRKKNPVTTKREEGNREPGFY